MKKICLWFTAVAVVTILCFTECKKDKQQPFAGPAAPQPDSSKIYLPVSIEGSNVTVSYSYMGSSDTLVLVAKQYSSGDTTCEISYESNQLHRFSTMVDGVGVSQTKYTLDPGGDVIRGDVYNVKVESDDWWGDYYVPTTLKAYYTLTYITSRQLNQVSFFHPDGQKDHDVFFEYTPEGNISGIHSPDNLNLEYDNFNGNRQVC